MLTPSILRPHRHLPRRRLDPLRLPLLRLVLPEEGHGLAPRDPKRLRRGIVGVFCSCPTWYSVPIEKSSRVFLVGRCWDQLAEDESLGTSSRGGHHLAAHTFSLAS